MFRGRAQSVLSARLGELADRHGNCRALVKRLWFVNGAGRRVQVWTLTPSGYGLAEEVLGRRLKVPRHDVASQFLEHATGVNELYVALAKRPDAPRRADWSERRGKPADDFARVPTAFRWVPSEDLELPFAEYVREEDRSRDRRLQPDALLEDPVRKRRYLIEYETGSATVRNGQHKTATLTKLARYSHFILGFAGADGKATFYSKHFADGFTPVVLFIARTVARRETIAEAAAGWGRRGGEPPLSRALAHGRTGLCRVSGAHSRREASCPGSSNNGRACGAAIESVAGRCPSLLEGARTPPAIPRRGAARDPASQTHRPCRATGRFRTQVSGTNGGRRAPSAVASRAQAGQSAVIKTGASSASM